MKTEIYQIIVPIIAIAGIAISIRQYKKGVYTLFESALTNLFWIFIALVAVFPDPISVFIADSIGIKDHINGVIFLGLAFLFFLNFRLFNLLKKQNKVITDLVRKIAIDQAKKKDKQE